MIRLIITDLDGTLIGRDEVLDQDAKSIVTLAELAGVPLTIATGRTQELAGSFARDLGITIPYIASNGATILQDGKVLRRHNIPLGGLRAIVAESDLMDLSVIYTIEGTEYVHRETSWILRQRMEFDRYHLVRPLSSSDWDSLMIEKMTVMDDVRDGRISIIEDLTMKLDDNYAYTKYTDKAVEIVHSEASKASAMEWVLEYLGISADEVVAFGDHQNDIDMLEKAGIGVAVANAIPTTKEAADVVTDLPGAAGVLNYLTSLLKPAR